MGFMKHIKNSWQSSTPSMFLKLKRPFATQSPGPCRHMLRKMAVCVRESELHKLSSQNGVKPVLLMHIGHPRDTDKAGRMPTVSLVTRRPCVLPPMAKGLHGSRCTHSQGLGSHPALDKQAPGTDWVKFIPDHWGVKQKEGLPDYPYFSSNNQSKLSKGASNTKQNRHLQLRRYIPRSP